MAWAGYVTFFGDSVGELSHCLGEVTECGEERGQHWGFRKLKIGRFPAAELPPAAQHILL